MDIQDEVNNVEDELAQIIIKHLEENKITPENAQQLAKDFLGVLPVRDHADLLVKLKELGQKYPEVQEVYVEQASEHEETTKENVLNSMRDAIKVGNIDQALQVAKTLQQ